MLFTMARNTILLNSLILMRVIERRRVDGVIDGMRHVGIAGRLALTVLDGQKTMVRDFGSPYVLVLVIRA